MASNENDTAALERSNYTAGLRALADLLDSTPELPLPSTREISWYLFGSADLDLDEQKSRAAEMVRMLPGDQRKWQTDDLFRFCGKIFGLKTQIIVDRDAVCRRVVTGTVEVTKTVPVTTEEVTVTEEVVEWVCEPLLIEATA